MGKGDGHRGGTSEDAYDAYSQNTLTEGDLASYRGDPKSTMNDGWDR